MASNIRSMLRTAACDTATRVSDDLQRYLDSPISERQETLANAVAAIGWLFESNHDSRYQLSLKDTMRICQCDTHRWRPLFLGSFRKFWSRETVALMENEIGPERMNQVVTGPIPD